MARFPGRPTVRTARSLLSCAAAMVLVGVLPAAAWADPAPPEGFNPVAGNEGFLLVVEGDAELVSNESEGTAAIGGDLTIGGTYNIAAHSAGDYVVGEEERPTALIVDGAIDYDGSDDGGIIRVLNDGYVHVGDLTGTTVHSTDPNGATVDTRITGGAYDSTPRIELTVTQPEESVGAPHGFDFDAVFATYRARAEALNACPTNVVLLDENDEPIEDPEDLPPGSRVRIELTEGEQNVLNLTGESLNNISEITFLDRPGPDTPLLVNVDTGATGGELEWTSPNLAGVSGEDAPYILWNFGDTTHITWVGGDTVEGTVYAPDADFTHLNTSNIEGNVITRSYAQLNGGELHDFQFDATLTPCLEPSPSPTPSPSPSPSPGPSPSPSPGPEPTPSPGPEPYPTPDDGDDAKPGRQLPVTGGALAGVVAAGTALTAGGWGLSRVLRR